MCVAFVGSYKKNTKDRIADDGNQAPFENVQANNMSLEDAGGDNVTQGISWFEVYSKTTGRYCTSIHINQVTFPFSILQF